MDWFTDLVDVAILVACFHQLREIRRCLEPRDAEEAPVASEPTFGEKAAEAIASAMDAFSGPSLPQVLTEEEELQLELMQHDTRGAQAGHVVNAYWMEQEEREYLDECSRSLEG